MSDTIEVDREGKTEAYTYKLNTEWKKVDPLEQFESDATKLAKKYKKDELAKMVVISKMKAKVQQETIKELEETLDERMDDIGAVEKQLSKLWKTHKKLSRAFRLIAGVSDDHMDLYP